MNDDIYKIALSLLPKVGALTARRLVAYAGSAEALFKDSKKNLLRIPNLGNVIADQIISGTVLKMAEEELVKIEKSGYNFYYFLDKNYPIRLRQCEDAPVVIFSKGEIKEPDKIVSIVGTRHPSEYGKQLCNELVKDLSEKVSDLQIVSGLAYGIDVTAHRAAIDNKLNNIAVLGHGLHMIYPASHRSISEKILENGTLITEFSSQKKPDPGNFVSRNRIIAGLADITIVVESATKGGALLTADFAFSYNREVAAFPGKVTDKYSGGCNMIIKQNKAALIENADDVIKLMNWPVIGESKPKQHLLFNELTEDEEALIGFLSEQEQLSLDELSVKSSKPLSLLKSELLNLEFKGIVKSLPGNAFKLIS